MNYLEHMLSIVGEECNEVGQRCSKAARFGMDEVQPGQPMNNADRILQEFNDLVGAMEILYGKPVQDLLNPDQIAEKHLKIAKYMDYSRSVGTLTDYSNLANHCKIMVKVDPEMLNKDITSIPAVANVISIANSWKEINTMADFLVANLYEDQCYVVRGLGFAALMKMDYQYDHLMNILRNTPKITVVIVASNLELVVDYKLKSITELMAIVDYRKNQ